MESEIKNFLYDNLQYYELVYPEPDNSTPEMCRRMFSRYLPQAPSLILDFGCGTGRDLDVLSHECPDCQGVDRLEKMIGFAKTKRPHLNLLAGDFRSIRLGRTFDVLLCLGSALMYALSNDDIEKVMETFSAHAHEGTLLILDIRNAQRFQGKDLFKKRFETKIKTPDFSATAVSTHTIDRRRQLLIRNRTWSIPGKPPIIDYCEYRMFFPAELDHLLSQKGFHVLGMFDNKELKESDLSRKRLYIAATKNISS